jgi:hypothetical protein
MKILDYLKLWSNVAYFTATACFIKANWSAAAPVEIWAVYLSVVGMHVTADKFIQLKFNGDKT